MVTVLALIGVAVALFLAAVLATREGPVLADAPPDAADVVLPPGPVQPEDVAAVRFSLAPRGYRMSEVDDVLDRLAAELADRDRRLALLEATIEGGTTAAPDQPAAAPVVDVVEAGEQDLPVPAPVQAPAGAAVSGSRPESSEPRTSSLQAPDSRALGSPSSGAPSGAPLSAQRPSGLPSSEPVSAPHAAEPSATEPLTAEPPASEPPASAPAAPVRPATSGPTAWTAQPTAESSDQVSSDQVSPVQVDDGPRPEPDRA